MANNIAFQKTNAIAQRWEDEVFILALNEGVLDYGYKWDGGYHPEYDIKLNLKDNKQIKIEVKGQTIYRPNNDVFYIEYLQKGKASGLDLTESDYYYIFKYGNGNKVKNGNVYIDETKLLMENIFYSFDVDQSEQNSIDYTLYKIKTSLIRQIIRNNPNLEVSAFNDSNKGRNETKVIPISMFDNFSSVERIAGKLDYDEYANLVNDDIVVFPNNVNKDKIYYAENPKDTSINLLSNPDEIDYGFGKQKKGSGYDSDSSGSSSSSSDSDTGLQLLKIISKK